MPISYEQEIASALASDGYDQLQVLVGALAADGADKIARSLSTSSYWHPNGFLKIIVATLSDGARFRIHYWPQKKSRSTNTDEEIHSHRWHYWSLILEGALKVETFSIQKQTTKIYKHFVCSANQKGFYELAPAENIGLTLRKSLISAAGSTHFGTPSTIHRTKPADDNCVVTAFMQSAALRPTSDVHRSLDVARTEEAKNSRPTVEDIANALRIVLKNRGATYE